MASVGALNSDALTISNDPVRVIIGWYCILCRYGQVQSTCTRCEARSLPTDPKRTRARRKFPGANLQRYRSWAPRKTPACTARSAEEPRSLPRNVLATTASGARLQFTVRVQSRGASYFRSTLVAPRIAADSRDRRPCCRRLTFRIRRTAAGQPARR